jgi:hypothetical protein
MARQDPNDNGREQMEEGQRPVYSSNLPYNPSTRSIRCRMGYSRLFDYSVNGAIERKRLVYRDPILQYYRSRRLLPKDDIAVSPQGTVQDHRHLYMGVLDEDAGLNRQPIDHSLRPRGTVETLNTTNVVWSYAGYTRTDPEGVVTPNLLRNVFLTDQGALFEDQEVAFYSLISNWIDSLGRGGESKLTFGSDLDADISYTDVSDRAAQSYRGDYRLQLPPPPNAVNLATGEASRSWIASQNLVDLALAATPKRLPAVQERETLMAIPFNTQVVSRQISVGTGMSSTEFRDAHPDAATNAHTVQTFIDTNFPSNSTLAALTVYPDSVYDEIISLTFVDFPYLEFDHETAFVEDIFTSKMSLFNQEANPDAPQPAYAKGEYNFFLRAYENGIEGVSIPEAVLPNYYVYNILADGGRNLCRRPEWQAPARVAEELQGNYDTLISPSEVFEGILPKMNNPEFLDYLTAYAGAVQGGVSVDYLNRLVSLYSNQAFAAAEMDIFDYLNRHKVSFPFYTEVSFPTNPITPVGEMLQQYNLSNQVSNVVKGYLPQEVTEAAMPFRLETSYVDITSPLENSWVIPSDDHDADPQLDPFILDEVSAQPEVREGLFLDRLINTMPFGEFYENLFQELEDMVVITRTGVDGVPGACNEQLKRMILTEIHQMVEDKSLTSMKTYEDVLGGDDICESEVLLYKLIKTKEGDELPLQTFYFPNSNLTDVIKFVDAQVKPDVVYNYELMACAVVYGTNFRFRTRSYNGQVEANLSRLERTSFSFRPMPNADDRVFFSFAIENLPLVHIIEYPVISPLWRKEPTMGGITYPPAVCRDYPPVPPLVFPQPYKNNHREVLFMFQPQSGDLTGNRAVPYVPLSNTDLLEMQNLSREQKVQKNFSLKRGYLEFRNDGVDEVQKIEIYRTGENPSAVSYADGAYAMFGTSPYKTLNIDCGEGVLVEDQARAFDFTDILDPNRRYYYTFRSVDMRGQKSNPTPIYQVELYFENGLYIPYISIYQPQIIPDSVKSRRFARFIEIRAADIQVSPYIQYSPKEGSVPTATAKNLISAKGEQQNHVSLNDFLIRVTSKDTGKRLDIRLTMPEAGPNPTEGQLCDDTVDSQRNGGPPFGNRPD